MFIKAAATPAGLVLALWPIPDGASFSERFFIHHLIDDRIGDDGFE